MENVPTENGSESNQSWWRRVTPLSKLLAMGLFILLPFVGGYIGYTYSPTSIVEVEKIVVLREEARTPPTVKPNTMEADVDWQAKEVTRVPSESGPGGGDPELPLAMIPWESLFGTIVGVIEEDNNRYIGFNAMKYYRGGGSCWSVNNYCVEDFDGNTLMKFKLAREATLTKTIISQSCDDIQNTSLNPIVTKDASGVEVGCVGTITNRTRFSDDRYYWLLFNSDGEVEHVVAQYIP